MRWLAYAALSTVDTVAAARRARRVRRVTKPALMPALAAAALPGSRSARPVRHGAALALAGSAAGDVALLGDGDRAFVAGVGGFLAGHAGWLAAAAGTPGDRGYLRRRPWLAAPFAAGVVAVNAAIQPAAPKELRAPIAVYSTVIGVMGALAVDAAGRLPARRSAATIAGALLFLTSDTLLAAGRFRGLGGSARRFDLVDGAVMATYTAAQGLLAYGLLGGRDSSGARG
ncbi:lysoplasmalogenase [Amycolatopsis anabasis]|uniref:lysoplasmalogenase n=1 Tax=Amycolatopsis anabasis TaxID=1840409 RepID=UPI00131C8A4C|nr:lysoplasmalogenase [Amycolatopsis anabasis]